MTTDAVSICNGALILLGATTITSLVDNDKNARAMNARYDDVRRAELRLNRWRFSIARASLAQLATTPDSDYDFQYELPNDFLRLLEGGDIFDTVDLSDLRQTPGAAVWSIEGRMILSNLASPLKIRYVYDVTDAALFDAAFVRVLSAALAYECCEVITQSDSKQQLALQRKKLALKDAKQANALEVAPVSVADAEWVAARSQ